MNKKELRKKFLLSLILSGSEKLKIIFIEETSKTKNNKCFLCLCGVIVDSSEVISLENELQKFKEKFNYSDFKDFRKPDNQSIKLRRTEYLKKILDKYNVNIISSVIQENSLNNIKIKYKQDFEGHQRYYDLRFILERFSFHLKRRNQTGLVIFDSLDNKIKNTMENLFYKDIISSNQLNNIFPSILFSKDEYSNILQISDLIGVSLNNAIYNSIKNYSKNNVDELPNFNPYLKIYWDLFAWTNRTNSVKGWGLKVWY